MMRQRQSDRLLFFDDDGPGVELPPLRRRPDAERPPQTVAAVLFLLSILLTLGVGLYFLVAWHVPRMH
jgi:hypothetical protein